MDCEADGGSDTSKGRGRTPEVSFLDWKEEAISAMVESSSGVEEITWTMKPLRSRSVITERTRGSCGEPWTTKIYEKTKK